MTSPAAGSATPPPICARCGVLVTGRFCSQCGAEAGRRCSRCGTPQSPGARFCHRCGAPAAHDRRTLAAWIGAAAVILVALVLGFRLVRTGPSPQAAVPPPPGAEGAGFARPAPDISSLTPRESFDRLYDRVLAAGATGDTAAMLALGDHALGAYAQLDRVDPGARYRAAMLHLQAGRPGPALALSDTILAGEPGHLLGLLIRGTVAERRGDTASLRRARSEFLAAWPAGALPPRADYDEHRDALERFRRSAETGGTPR